MLETFSMFVDIGDEPAGIELGQLMRVDRWKFIVALLENYELRYKIRKINKRLGNRDNKILRIVGLETLDCDQRAHA
jgi:hypothetical protein